MLSDHQLKFLTICLPWEICITIWYDIKANFRALDPLDQQVFVLVGDGILSATRPAVSRYHFVNHRCAQYCNRAGVNIVC